MGDAESEPFVKVSRGIGFDDPKCDRLAGLRGLIDQVANDAGADAAPLEGGVDEDLLQAKGAIPYRSSRHPCHLT
jgi:hypothetical protein